MKKKSVPKREKGDILRIGYAKASQRQLKGEDGRRVLDGKKLWKHYLQLGQALDGFQWSQNSKYPQRLDSLDISPLVGSVERGPQGAIWKGDKQTWQPHYCINKNRINAEKRVDKRAKTRLVQSLLGTIQRCISSLKPLFSCTYVHINMCMPIHNVCVCVCVLTAVQLMVSQLQMVQQ